MHRKKILCPLILAVALINAGCTVSEVISAETTELNVASLDIAESMLLDIGILNFDAGIPEKNNIEKSGIYPEIRQAEARYLPYHIKTTLQGTGYWGAVRVIPNRYVFTDVTIVGRIVRSDGEFVTLNIKVEDSLGNEWYEKDYSAQTGLTSYNEYRDRTNDPYQKAFNDIANDLRAYVSTLEPHEITRLRQVSELKFFADMAPSAYAEHLAVDADGKISIVRLPARNDPMATRLRQIRERDRLVIDTLNEHYANFYYGIALPYEGWRKNAREQAVMYRQTKRSATMRALLGVAVIAGSMSIDTGGAHTRTKQVVQYVGVDRGLRTIFDAWRIRSSAGIYRENIRELSESFVAEAAPLVIEVEGESRSLTGTAEAQYESWRKLLHEIYEVETGFSDDVDLAVSSRSTKPAG